MTQPDWNQLRAYLETVETGSLSAAARKQALGVTLFERTGQAMVLTDAGLSLLEHGRTEQLGLAGAESAVGSL